MKENGFIKEIFETVKVLKAGGTILYPTDTIWGIGCDATNARAVQKIYKIKKRIENKSLIVLLDKSEKLKKYVKNVPEIVYDLIIMMDKPLTIIYPGAKNLAKNVIARDKTIAIRIVKDKFCQKLISLFDKPIVSSSANISGDTMPLTFNNISDEIINNVDYVVKIYHHRIKEIKPSTIIKLDEKGGYTIIRN